MRVKRLVKHLVFTEEFRSQITLGPNTRLNPKTERAELLADSVTGKFPLTADLFVKTRLTNPTTVRQWLSFEAVITNKLDSTNVPATNIQFRLDDGTTEFFHNGSAWVAAGASDWNTEAQVATNIATFPVTAKQIRVVINLVSLDDDFTPEVDRIKILWSSDIEFQEDIIYRSLVPLLKAQIRPIARNLHTMVSASAILNVNQFDIDTPYNLVNIDSIFNDTTDPNKVTDILSSFDSVSGLIVLTGGVAAGDVLFIRFTYEPEVAVTTSQEFIETQKVPEIVLNDINLIEATEIGQDDGVVDKGAGTAVKVFAPLQGNLEILIQGITDKAIDHQRLSDEMKRFFRNNPLLKSTGLDEPYRLWLIEEYDQRTTASLAELHTWQARIQIMNVRYWLKDALDTFAVEQLNLVFAGDATSMVIP